MPSSSQSPTPNWEPPSLERLQQMLPQYEISGILGRGGMGAVYRGRQAKLDREVAIKILPETFTSGDDELNFAKRFQQEAQAMAKLDHPAIISVYDFGETDDSQLYFVMEFIDGMDIHQYLRQHGGRLPQEHALSITAHVLDALEYAHNHGIIHRDIKPANILLNHEGRVKIADFGLAKCFTEEGDDSVPALTMSNAAVGTPDYLAPEALEHEKTPDHRADVYAVGVMLYQMLTGSMPRGQFKLPSAMVPDLDPRIDEIVSQSLQTDPDDRYASASAVRSALDPIFTTPITKVEGGEAEEEIPQAILVEDDAPVGGGLPKPKEAEKPKAPLYFGIGLAATLAIGGLAALLMKDDGGKSSVESQVSTPAKEAGEKERPKQSGNGGASEKGKSKKGDASAGSPAVAVAEPKNSEPADSRKAKSEKGEAPGKGIAQSSPPETPGSPATAIGPGSEKPEPKPADTAAAAAPTRPSMPADPPPGEKPKGKAPEKPAIDLAAIPGLKARLEAYLSIRRKQVSDLAANYLRGLDGRLNQAADAGDLKLVKAFRQEKRRVADLQKSLAEPVTDPIGAVNEAATLPDLPEDSLAGLVTIRQTWSTERKKIRDTLDGQLRQSLKALESQLTKKRQFDHAETVLAYREGLFQPPVEPEPKMAAAAKPSAPGSDSSDSEPTSSSKAAPPNPFGWQPIPKNPFPLPRPTRPVTPCRAFAWRLDGEPVDENEFREIFGGVPADLGEVVDLSMQSRFPDDNLNGWSRFQGYGTKKDGGIVTMREQDQRLLPSDLTEVVQVSVASQSAAALISDGTARFWGTNPGALEKGKESLAAVQEWRDLVSVAPGGSNVSALQSNGDPMVAGVHFNPDFTFPEGFDRNIVRISAPSEATVMLVRHGPRSGELIVRRKGGDTVTNSDGRRLFFDGDSIITADKDGELIRGTWAVIDPTHPKHIRGRRPADVRHYERVVRYLGKDEWIGLAAARSGEDQWHFWGDLGDVCDVDFDHCEKKAAGSWKVFFCPPYAVGLKPTDRMKPDDWTGPGAGANPPVTKTDSDRSKIFPLPIPERPKIPGKVIAFRLDGEPVDWDGFKKVFDGHPDDLGEVVAISGGLYLGSESRPSNLFAIASDGSLRSLRQNARGLMPKESIDAVDLAWGGQSVLTVLRADGTVQYCGSPDVEKSLQAIGSWKDLVAISMGSGSVYGLQRDGNLLTTGLNDMGQLNVPSKAQGQVTRIFAKGGKSALLATSDYRLFRFGSSSSEHDVKGYDRIFFGINTLIGVDERGGSWAHSSDPGTMPNHPGNARRDLRDIEHLVTLGTGAEVGSGISAARLVRNRWHWWGKLEQRSGFDADHCEKMSEGCLDLVIHRPYVLALKAVSP